MTARVPKTNWVSILWRYLCTGDPLTWLGSLILFVVIVFRFWFIARLGWRVNTLMMQTILAIICTRACREPIRGENE